MGKCYISAILTSPVHETVQKIICKSIYTVLIVVFIFILSRKKPKHSLNVPLQKIFTEPKSLSMSTVDKLREKCRQQILKEESGQP